uniref:4-hydroxybenzoate polyprenyltransferase, mitochondrial n=1 Tax=Meloidogyne javanica TaxID=6303 RepID=A0A915MB12_MELJA
MLKSCFSLLQFQSNLSITRLFQLKGLINSNFLRLYSTTNKISKLPEKKTTNKLISCLKLMRVDKPIGTWLLYWPGAWSIALSASPGCLPDAYLLGLFGVGSFLMRSSGCILNDLWDQDIDKKVARTKSRPLANGELTEKEAVLLLGGLLSASLAVLLQLNSLSIILGASSLWLVVVYPLAKRFTNWPQLVLGCTAVTGKFVPEICIPLYLACICWTMIYDTIYAFQDKKEDILIGLGSTAIVFDKNREAWLNFFGLTMMSNLLYSGYMQELPWPFFVSLLGCTAVTGKFVPEICIPLYLACICWTMIYDTIYAFQDKKEDILIGLGSTAIVFDKNREAWLNFFGLTMMSNLLYSGYMQELPWPFFVSLLGGFLCLCSQERNFYRGKEEDFLRERLALEQVPSKAKI